jgi:hypothetical protein
MKCLNYKSYLKNFVIIFCLLIKQNILLPQGWEFINKNITTTPNLRVDRIISDYKGNLVVYPDMGSILFKWDGANWQTLNPLNSNLKLKYCSIGAVYNDTLSNKLYVGGYIEDSLSRNVLIYYDGLNWNIVNNSHQILLFGGISCISKDNNGYLYIARCVSSNQSELLSINNLGHFHFKIS